MALCQKFGRLLIGAEARFSARTDVTNISTSLDQSPAPTQIAARLPYVPNAFTLFTKDQMTGQSGQVHEMGKILSTNWKNLSEDEKEKYSERAKKIGAELRDNFEKLTNGQKKDLWDKHVEKMIKRQRIQMRIKLNKFYAETNRPKQPLKSYMVFVKERFEKKSEPINTMDKVRKFGVEMGQQWRQMTDAEKRPYVAQWQCNIPAYHMEMAEWKQKYANEIRAWKEAEAKAAQKARDTQFNQAPFKWNIDADRGLNEQEAIQQMLLDDSTNLVEKRERSSDDDRDVEEAAASQRSVTNISTSLKQSPASTQIPARLPSEYNAPKSFALFMKDQMTGKCGRSSEIVKIVSTNWKNLSEEEKQSHSERAKKIGAELRDNFEKLTDGQKKDLWDKHVEKRNKLQRYRLKMKLHKIPARLPPGYKELNAFALFTKDQMTGKSGGGLEMMKIVLTNWKSLGEDEKQEYSERAKKIGAELRDNFEKLTDGQKKDLWDKHVEKRNKLQRLQMKKKLQKFYAETNRPKLPPRSYMVFMKECFEKQTKPIKTKVEQNKFVAEMAQQWRQMTDAEKQPYVDQTQDNIAKFRVEMAEWKQKYANEIRAWKEAALKARDTQFNKAHSEWNIDGDRDVDEKEAIQQMLLDDSTHLVEKRERSSDDDRDVEEAAAIQRIVFTNQSPAPTQIAARLPYVPNAFTLFTKDQMTGQSGQVHEMGKILSTNWKNLSEDEKQKYSERAKKIGAELRDNFEKLTNGQKKDLWDKHVEKRNKLQRYRLKKKLRKFYAETNRPKNPLFSYAVFMKKSFEKQTEPFKTRDEVKKFAVETGQQWRQMTDAEKQPYIDQGQGDRAAYHKEMAEWKQKYANEIRAWKEAEAEAAQKAMNVQFTETFFEWNIDDKDVEEKEAIHQMLLDDSTHLVEKRERSSDDDRDVDEEEEEAIQRMFLAISTYLGRKEISQKQRVEY